MNSIIIALILNTTPVPPAKPTQTVVVEEPACAGNE